MAIAELTQEAHGRNTRKLSFSPSISSQMESYVHHCDYTSKLRLVKNGFSLTMGKVPKFFSDFFFCLNLRISLTGVHQLCRDIDFGDAQGIGILKFR